MVADDSEKNPRHDNLTQKALPPADGGDTDGYSSGGRTESNGAAPQTRMVTDLAPLKPEPPLKIRPHDGDQPNGDKKKDDGKGGDQKGADAKEQDDKKGGDEDGKKHDQKDDGDQKDGDEKAKKDDPKKKRKRIIALSIFGAILVFGGIAAFIYWLHARDFETTDDAFIDGHVVAVSPQVAARVLEVRIDDNFGVKQNDVLIRLDPTDYQVAVDQANANKEAMLAKRVQAQSDVVASSAARDSAAADVEVAKVNLENAQLDLHRYEVIDPRARSQQDYDNAIRTEKAARAQLAQVQAKVAQAEAQIETSKANVTAAQGDVDQADANLKKALVNLGYCTIVAPEDGKITLKNVEPGMYVTPGQTFFDIVPYNVWVVANFKETQLTDMRPNQPVTITVDAYPDHTFHGHIDSLQSGTGARFSVLPAENATGNYVKVVQRVPVKIVFDRDSEKKDREEYLSPGLSVEPKVRVRGANDD
jgi:membrane fusion protein (multidrug efflux system)